jgi:S-DNA-T family DNA segregation ATPase FtsK/SpoIIIE
MRAPGRFHTGAHLRAALAAATGDLRQSPAHGAARRADERWGMGQRGLRAIVLVALCVFTAISWVAYREVQWPLPATPKALAAAAHVCGPFGLVVTHATVAALGRVGAAALPLLLALFAVATVAAWERRRVAAHVLRLVAAAAFIAVLGAWVGDGGAGGAVGRLELEILRTLLGQVGATILLAAILAGGLLRIGTPIARPVLAHGAVAFERAYGAGALGRDLWQRLKNDVQGLWHGELGDPEADDDGVASRGRAAPAAVLGALPAPAARAAAAPRIRDLTRAPQPRVVEHPGALPAAERDEPMVRSRDATRYHLPALDVLAAPEPLAAAAASDAELLEMSRRLEEKLADFGIGGRVSEVQPGPVITTFEFEPAPGIKVSQVTSRVDDLAMALRAQSIRMVAPIPGKAAIGVEIPNRDPQMVALQEIMSAWSDELRVGPLGLALGKTVSGEPFFADLATMPHLLVAGATGSGKSVCINVILCSLLLRHDPNEVKLLLVDPKMLELNAYKDIPHLLHPVVTDPKEAYKALHWLTVEMERRYRELARAGVRNIVGYNKKVAAGDVQDEHGAPKDILPYVVVIVDELADLMIQVGGEIETPIARLAQMARAVGIHLVLATQRPSVDVITGVIKANFPSRIAFQVSSRVDSRTILDGNGAEALLGRGDMLFLAGGRPTPIRLHGAFVSVEECERVAAHWRQFGQGAGALDLDEARAGGGADASADDDLFEAARQVIVSSGVASVSYLQRRLKVGYSRAARIMDMLEDAGVVGAAMGAKPREVLQRIEDLPPVSG